jgi:hypothetical protein
MTFFSSLVMGRFAASMSVAMDGDAIIFSSLPSWPFSRGTYVLMVRWTHNIKLLGCLRKCNLDKNCFFVIFCLLTLPSRHQSKSGKARPIQSDFYA